MTITAKIVADSISEDGIRLTTFQCRYPRMIHAELMTHRDFSRNGRSSRAVPVKRLLLEAVYVPHFMKNQPGMMASEELTMEEFEEAVAIWNAMAAVCKDGVKRLGELGVHKQWANRPLEWFGYIDVLITSTNWANFFALRDEVGAQPEIDTLAKLIKTELANSKPKLLQPGEWHLPYIMDEDWKVISNYAITNYIDTPENHVELAKKISTARCARLSIAPFDGDGSIERELKRYELLMESRPVHASPAEHIATPDKVVLQDGMPERWQFQSEHGNFNGWRQFRKQIVDNTIYDER
jgi:hypothetical protein